MRSRRGPSFSKLVTRNHDTFWLSPRPELDATLYRTTSRPVEVAESSGVAARLPTMVILARGRALVLLKARANRGAAMARRAMKLDILGAIDFGNGSKNAVGSAWSLRACDERN